MNITGGRRRRLSGPGGPPSTNIIIFTIRPLLYQFIASASDAPSHTLGSAAAAAAEDASDDVVWHYYSTTAS